MVIPARYWVPDIGYPAKNVARYLAGNVAGYLSGWISSYIFNIQIPARNSQNFGNVQNFQYVPTFSGIFLEILNLLNFPKTLNLLKIS